MTDERTQDPGQLGEEPVELAPEPAPEPDPSQSEEKGPWAVFRVERVEEDDRIAALALIDPKVPVQRRRMQDRRDEAIDSVLALREDLRLELEEHEIEFVAVPVEALTPVKRGVRTVLEQVREEGSWPA